VTRKVPTLCYAKDPSAALKTSAVPGKSFAEARATRRIVPAIETLDRIARAFEVRLLTETAYSAL
jgi:hypothetical protein